MGITPLLKKVILLVVGILVVGMILAASQIDWPGLLGLGITGEVGEIELQTSFSGNIVESPEMVTFYNYGGLLYSNEFMDPTKDQAQVDTYFAQKETYIRCTECFGCTGEKCTTCASCSNIDYTLIDADYSSCEGCIGCTGSTCTDCAICIDANSESLFCRSLKYAIERAYAVEKEVDVLPEQITRGEDLSSTIITSIKDELAACKPEQIMIGTGADTEKEVCYFEPDFRNEEPYSTGKYYNSYEYSSGTKYVYEPISTGFTDGQDTLVTMFLQVEIENDGMGDDPQSGVILICKGYVGRTGYAEMKEKCNIDLPYCIDDPDAENCLIDLAEWKMYSEDDNVYTETFIIPTTLPYEYVSAAVHWKDEDDGEYYVLGGLTITGYKLIIYPLTDNFRFDNCLFGQEIDPEGYIKIIYPEQWTSTEEGHIKISLGNLKTERQRNCEFNLYVCDSNAFTNSSEDTLIEIYDFFRTFYPGDIRFEDNSLPYPSVSYNYYEFELDKSYKQEDIVEAIKQGYDYWVENDLPYLYGSAIYLFDANHHQGTVYKDADQWKVSDYVYPENLCSDIEIEDSLVDLWYGTGREQNKKVIERYCPSGICKNTLKLRVEFRLNDYDEIQPFIWFCGE